MRNLEDDIKRAYWLREEGKAMLKEADDILDSYVFQARNYPAGDFILQVTPTVRFDPATAEQNLPSDKYQSILKLTPNAALAKAVLSKSDFKATQKEYGMTRKIIPVTDAE